MNLIRMVNGSGTADAALTFFRKFLNDASCFTELFESGVRDEYRLLDAIPEKISEQAAGCAELQKQINTLLANVAELSEQARVVLENANQNSVVAISLENAVRQKISNLQSKRENCLREQRSLQESAHEIHAQIRSAQNEQDELARRSRNMQHSMHNEARNLSNAESAEYWSSCRDRLERMRQEAAGLEQQSQEIASSLEMVSSAAMEINRAEENLDRKIESITEKLANLDKIHEGAIQNQAYQKDFLDRQMSDYDALNSLQEKLKIFADKLEEKQCICAEARKLFQNRRILFSQQAGEIGGTIRSDSDAQRDQINSVLALVSNIREAAFCYEHIE